MARQRVAAPLALAPGQARLDIAQAPCVVSLDRAETRVQAEFAQLVESAPGRAWTFAISNPNQTPRLVKPSPLAHDPHLSHLVVIEKA